MRRSILHLSAKEKAKGFGLLMITASNVSFGYGRAFQLENITFQMQKGDFWGIIGPNGSGKSTLLKVLSRIVKTQTGEIKINGTDLRSLSLPELAKRMAVVGSEAQFSFP